MILDRVREVITAWPIVLADDGYGGKVPTPAAEPITFKAAVIPVGFSGAGWAINSKLESQGFADVARVRLIFKPLAGIERWSRLEFQGREWTVQEDPRALKGLRARQDYITITVELRGDA